MAEEFQYQWTDNPTVSGVAKCDTDVLNECLMHLKYDNGGGTGLQMFDTILKDHILTYEESKGLELQGTYVYKTAIAGERYGYPDFYAKVVKEYNEATVTETINDVTVKVNANGHKFFDIADKASIDAFYNTMGTAWFYGIDTENERIFLPRDKYFAVNGVAPVVGNGMTLGLTDGSITFGITKSHPNNNRYLNGDINLYGQSVGTSAVDDKTNSIKSIGITTDPTKSGIEAHLTANEDKYLYICVGNTVSDTSWVDVVTQVQGGVKDLEDKTLEGIDRLKQSSTALTQTQITNCLLEVPQNIKLELNNGTLTLKAGSIVTVPNGFEADGTTPKFDYVTVESDVLFDFSGWGTTKRTLTFNTVLQKLEGFERDTQTSSGSTVPAVNYGYMTWYDTANNLVKYSSDSGATWSAGGSLPLAIFSGGDSVLDQVFNGFGYIGSTVWVDKGVKCLIPNGRNEDGTLNNIEYTTPTVIYETQEFTGWNGKWSAYLTYNGDLWTHPTELHYVSNVQPSAYTLTAFWENLIDNKLYSTADTGATWQQYLGIKLFDITESDTKITSLTSKQPFRAVDYNDYVNTPHITETYVNGTSWYRVWSDGWIEQGGETTTNGTTVKFLKAFSNANYTINMTCTQVVGNYEPPSCIDLTATSFKATRMGVTGNNGKARWYACGY